MNTNRVRIAATVKASVSSDGLVLLDVRGGVVLASNPVGARIWQLLEQERPSLEIARQLAGEFGIPEDRAAGDVAAFIAALSARGLLTAALAC